ncbi:hypothetical protein JB92DRAFT_3050655 [Gautieria morchelliformis]|nr:hypothetical protein JB92DRAFT_3050655 [Gautieria morchelliformis]
MLATMLGTAVILLFISAATCSSTSRNCIPLSAPLPNGTMVLQCPPKLSFDRCLENRGCCSNNKIQGGAIESLCGNSDADHSESVAQVQHDLNIKVALCHFDGHSADNVQLLLTPNGSAFLDSLNRQDEELRRQQAVYLALQIIGGHIGLPILLLFSIFPKKPPRNLIFLNFCFTWIFSSITFSIGLYRLGPASMRKFMGPGSDPGVPLPFMHSVRECLAQAALVSGAQVMTDTAMCALIVQLWLDIRAAIHGPLAPGKIRWTLLSAPYLSLLAFSLPALSASPTEMPPVQTGFYCFLFPSAIFFLCQYAVLIGILIATLIFDVCIIRILYRHWRFFRRPGENGLQVSLFVVLRVIIFCVYRVVITVAYVATVLHANWGFSGPNGAGPSFSSVWVDMLQAGTPLVAFLIFGTSKEFRHTLRFWKRFNPILDTLMFRRRRSPGTQESSNARGMVFDVERVVSGDSVLDIGQETKVTGQGLAL